MTVKDTNDVFRLYCREWVTAQTITTTAFDGIPAFELAKEWVAQNLAGRVHEKHIRITVDTDGNTAFWSNVLIYKDNLKGEFKHAENAQAYALLKKFDEYTIVPRNSKSDHDIRNYGVVKL